MTRPQQSPQRHDPSHRGEAGDAEGLVPRSSRAELEAALLDALTRGESMNDFLQRFLDATGKAFSTSKLVLYDYDEVADTFDLLFFDGYPANSRSELRKRMHRLDLRAALLHDAPKLLADARSRLMIPLYFQDTLEAVLLLESEDRPFALDESVRSTCRLLSRFLGLFMSSSRLPVNEQRSGLAAVSDLRRAREVQMTYLPLEHPITDRYEIYGYNQSSALVGGDYFGYFQHRERSIQCVVADACGHGLASALVMSHFRGLLHAELAHAGALDPLFNRMNLQIHAGEEMIQYLTGVFFEYEEETRRIRYLNAGHFDPLVVHADGSCSRLPGGGPPLGMFRESTYELNSGELCPGDVLVVFTDGLVELHNERDEFFGVEGILQAVLAGRNLPLKSLARDVLARAAGFSSDVPPQDDLTLFLMRIR